MKYLSKDEYKQELASAKRYSKQKEMRQEIKAEARSWKKIEPKMETSKKLAIYLFVLMNVVVIYCLVAMWYFADMSYLGVLITDIASQILIYGIYCLKAYKAKKQSEDMKFRREKMQGLGDILTSGAEARETVPVRGDMAEFSANDNEV